MSHWKSFGSAILATLCLPGEASRPAQAQYNPQATEWSDGNVINLEGLSGYTQSGARAINDKGQVVGNGLAGGTTRPTELSGGSIIDLGGLPGSTVGYAHDINDAGQVVGVSYSAQGSAHAIEWSNGQVIDLAALTGSSFSYASGINSAGQVVGSSFVGVTQSQYAIE
jgi:probable HAF family extracellular repeat protein